MGRKSVLIIRGLIGGLFQLTTFAGSLLIPADTWYWLRALQFLAVYGIILLGSIILLALLAPDSLEARLLRSNTQYQPVADRIVTLLLSVLLLAWLVFIPIDVFYLQLLPPPSLWVSSILGVMLLFAGFGVLITAIFQNSFAAPIVSYQSERGQFLVNTGLYGLIRHPLYLGLFLFLIGLALWLESYGSLLVLPVILVLVVVRIFIEESTLQKNLPGYLEYMNQVRYRLIPLIW